MPRPSVRGNPKVDVEIKKDMKTLAKEIKNMRSRIRLEKRNYNFSTLYELTKSLLEIQTSMICITHEISSSKEVRFLQHTAEKGGGRVKRH